MVQYEVEEELSTLSTTKTGGCKRLCLVSWNNNAPKYDIRMWYPADDGDLKPGKGISLTEDEARKLAADLSENFED